MRKMVITVFVWIVLCFGYINVDFASVPEDATLVTATYIVASGDTLDAISYKYIAKSTYGPRDIREFREGIIELNWAAVFADRPIHGMIYPGDKLTINYWTKGADEKSK